MEQNLSDKKLHIDFATVEAARTAVERFHYSKSYPLGTSFRFGAWEYGKFVGAVCFGNGGSPNMIDKWAKEYDWNKLDILELVRVAFKEHEASISKIISISLSMLKKHVPNIQVVVSYADTNYGHHGGIYQASNWIYLGMTPSSHTYRDRRGKIWHSRSEWCVRKGSAKFISGTKHEKSRLVVMSGKHRYVWIFDKKLRAKIALQAKEYPKAAEAK